MRLKRLYLKGAIGIQRGLGLSEIDLDLSGLPPGVIALCGDNGSGKSTVLDNAQGFPTLFRSEGGLYENFYEAQSERSLDMEFNGSLWNFRLLINPSKRTTEGFVSKDGEVVNTGRMGEYLSHVESIFGPEDIFTRSVFGAQFGTSFASMKRAPRREFLFSIIPGLSKYSDLNSIADDKASVLVKQIINLNGRLETLREETDCTELGERLSQLGASEQEASDEALRVRNLLARREEKLSKYDNILASINENKIRAAEINEEIAALKQKEETKKTLFKDTSAALAHKLDELIASMGEIGSIMEQKDELLARRKALEETASGAKIRAELNIEIASLENRLTQLKNEHKEQARKLKEFNIAVSEKIPCMEDIRTLCPLHNDAVKNIPSEEQVEDKVKYIEETDKKIKAQTAEAAKHSAHYDPSELSGAIALSEKAINAAELMRSHEERKADLTARIEEEEKTYHQEIMAIQDGLEHLEAKLIDLKTEAKPEIIEAVASLQAEIGEMRTSLKSTEDRIEAVRIDIGIAKGEIKKRQEKRATIERMEAERHKYDLRACDWDLLARAFSRNGIPLLKLEHLCAGIENYTNTILAEGFGKQWSVEFRTQRQSADGKRMLEALDLVIYKDGEETTIETLSGGEDVWVSTALGIGIALYNSATSGRKFETLFLDERDGALTAKNRHAFLRVLEAAMEIGGLYHIFLVSHDPSVQAAASGKIIFSKKDGINIEI